MENITQRQPNLPQPNAKMARSTMYWINLPTMARALIKLTPGDDLVLAKTVIQAMDDFLSGQNNAEEKGKVFLNLIKTDQNEELAAGTRYMARQLIDKFLTPNFSINLNLSLQYLSDVRGAPPSEDNISDDRASLSLSMQYLSDVCDPLISEENMSGEGSTLEEETWGNTSPAESGVYQLR